VVGLYESFRALMFYPYPLPIQHTFLFSKRRVTHVIIVSFIVDDRIIRRRLKLFPNIIFPCNTCIQYAYYNTSSPT